MFRRRRPFRPIRRALMRPPVNPVIIQAVSRANQLLANGNPDQAAEIYARLAQEGESRRRMRPAANAHAHAANAYVIAKNESAALTHARTALNQFIQLDMPDQSAAFYNNMTQSLRDNRLNGAADILHKEFGDRIKVAKTQSNSQPTQRGRLPSKCPQCAAPARSDEVSWIDEYSAECAYCGGVIQTEET